MTPTNPRILVAPALRRWIAERLGWRPETASTPHGNDMFMIVSPDGVRIDATTPDLVDGPWKWYEDGAIPDWLSDVAAALALITDTDDFHLARFATEWEGKYRAYVNGSEAFDHNPALAISMAWAIWTGENNMDQQQIDEI